MSHIIVLKGGTLKVNMDYLRKEAKVTHWKQVIRIAGDSGAVLIRDYVVEALPESLEEIKSYLRKGSESGYIDIDTYKQLRRSYECLSTIKEYLDGKTGFN